MKDINNPLIKAYVDALAGIGYPVYEGEEPDDTLDKVYIVINGVNSNDSSTKTTTDVNAQIQATINSWEFKYNNCKLLNEVAGLVLEAIKPNPNAVLDMSAYNMQMHNLSVVNDRQQDYGKLAGRVYISRQIVFKQDIFIIN